ncbi:hypothetical protein, partial [Neisseria sicca]|uniref:hypothetical protein n=1 Tax=Neisseria sicca TaxID=490 RepID=UPI001C9933D2
PTPLSAQPTQNPLKLTSSQHSTTNLTTYNFHFSHKTKHSFKKPHSPLQGIHLKLNDQNLKTFTKHHSTLKFLNPTPTTPENKRPTLTFNLNKSTLTTGAPGLVSPHTP